MTQNNETTSADDNIYKDLAQRLGIEVVDTVKEIVANGIDVNAAVYAVEQTFTAGVEVSKEELISIARMYAAKKRKVWKD